MSGTIAYSLSQQFDAVGAVLAGGKLYFYQAGTVATPQNAYQDYGLTLLHPNPITLDAAGRVPQFFLADGFIKTRLVDKNGAEQVTADNLLVIGPSSGGGGGGGVDATTVFQTGDCFWLDTSGTRTGWVRDNGRTIGSATSGATERANSDTSALYTFLWNAFSNTICPVSGGRGASAAADFAANKTLQLPDKRGYVPGGLDDMGNSAAGRYASVPIVSGSVTAAGSVLGENLHTLTSAELAAHTHTVTVTDPGHAHSIHAQVGSNYSNGGNGFTRPLAADPVTTGVIEPATTGITAAANANTGGGGAHNNAQLTVLGTFYRKL